MDQGNRVALGFAQREILRDRMAFLPTSWPDEIENWPEFLARHIIRGVPNLSAYIGLFRKYGALDFSKVAAERLLSRLTGGASSAFFYQRALAGGRVYFGEHLGARQGVTRRHATMFELASNEIRRSESHRFQVLEVGSYAGASAITWALALKTRADRPGQVTCVDPWRNYLTDADIAASATPGVLRQMARALEEGRVRELFQHNVRMAQVADVVLPIAAPFAEFVKSAASGPFDIIYIDANHRCSEVSRDLNLAAPLLRPGGVLCGDDLEVQWPDLDQARCRTYAEHDLIVDPKTGLYMHPGVAKAVWDFFGSAVSNWNGFWAMRKRADGGWEPVTMPEGGGRKLPPHLAWWKPSMAGAARSGQAEAKLSSST
jgi:predicted O-methyltransferase YrrM